MSKKNTAPATAEVPAVKEESALVIPAEVSAGNWGAIEDLETTDLLVPKIFHQQAMSKFVAEGLARPGDFCDSLTGQVLAKKEEKLEVIIFGSYKTMIVSILDVMAKPSPRYKLKEIITITPDNARDWASVPLMKSTEEGDFKYNLQYNFYCLIPALARELPFVLSLGSTKTKVAKKLNTMLYKLSQLRRPGASVVFELASVPEKNDQGAWFGLEVSQGRNSTPEELLRAHAWYLKSKSQTIVAAEEDQSHDSHDSEDESEINV